MGAPTVYKSTDANAPVLAGVNTSMIALLTACLVTGYGTKPAAGWSRPYVDGAHTKAVFRNNPATGTGFYLRVDNTGTAYAPVIQGYESMTDIDTGVNPIAAGTNYLLSSNVASTAERPWVMIADDRFFILVVWPTILPSAFTSQSFATFVAIFGDGISLHASDAFCCFLASGQSTTYGYSCALSTFSAGTATGNGQYIARKSSGVAAVTEVCLVHGGGPSIAATYATKCATTMPRATYGPIFSRPYLNDSLAYTLRGYLPGVWNPCNLATDYANFEEIVVGTHRMLMLNLTSVNAQTVIAIDISENFRP